MIAKLELRLNVGRVSLSSRQREVLVGFCRGLRNREIAGQLGLSIRTIKAVLTDLLAGFDVTNRTELVGLIAEEGLLGVVLVSPDAVEGPTREFFPMADGNIY
jgi:DNA-binding NarL/FixJ family response regulator